MTGGAGFSNDAMNTGRSNRASRTSNHAKFKEGQNTFLAGGEPLNFKEVSPEELAKVKHEIQEEAKKERIKTLIIGLVVGAVVLATVLYFIL